MVEKWGDDYTLLGPYFTHTAAAEFEPLELSEEDTPIHNSIRTLRLLGLKVYYGHWLITGKPKIILFDIDSIYNQIDAIKGKIWENHKISTLGVEELVNQTIAFGEMVRLFITELALENKSKKRLSSIFMNGWPLLVCPIYEKIKLKYQPSLRPMPRCWGVI